MTARYLGGVMLATAAAGPLSTLLLAARLAGGGVSVEGVAATLFVGITYGLVIGSFVAVIPALAVSTLLAWLGGRSGWARHPALWAAVGFAIGGAIAGLAVDSFDEVWVLGMPGAACGLLARWQTRWSG